MELKAYAAILWRRIWIIALIVGIVGLYVGYQYYHLRKTPGALSSFHSSVTMQVGLQATAKGTDPSYADNVVVSESLADALTTGPVLTLREFDAAVVQQIATDRDRIVQRYGPNPDLGNLDPGAVGGALSPSHIHSLVTIDVSWITPAGAWAIASAVSEVLTTNIGSYLDYVVANNPAHDLTANQVQPAFTARILSAASDPYVGGGSAGNKTTLLILMVLLALLVGIALAFLVDYLDDRLRDKEEVAQLLQVPVYGNLPRPPASGRSSVSRKLPVSAT